MGTRSLGALAERLLANGHDADTPLLIISNASLPSQTIRSGTFATAGALAREAQDRPSLILIGAVAAQNHSLFTVKPTPEVAYA